MIKKIKCRPVRNAWLVAIYENELVEASVQTKKYADKLYFYESLKQILGDKIHDFHPKTIGLGRWMTENGFNNHANSLDAVLKKLHLDFPKGVILKPSTIINSGGEVGLYLFKTEEVAKELSVPSQAVASAINIAGTWVSDLLGLLASGEEFILQENIATLAGYSEFNKAKELQEIRIHTYEDQVLFGGSYSRWSQNEIKNDKDFYIAQDFVQKFLNALPKDFTKKQAWGLDILIFENGFCQILEVNTNRGKQGQWTGFLSRPELLGFYTRQMEKHYPIRFVGFGGFLLKMNLGNVTKNWKKKYIEGIS